MEPETLYWGLEERSFALTTACREVVERARVVLAGWLQSPSAPTVCHWTVIRQEAGWDIRQDQNDQVESRPTVDDVVIWLEYGAILLLDFPNRLKVHGALLIPPAQERALLLLGHGGAGKSTLATALFGQGWTLLSDDVVFIDCARCEALAAPRRVALRQESRDLLGEELWQRILTLSTSFVNVRGPLFHAHNLGPRKVRLSALVILKNETPEGGMRSVEAAEAVFAMSVYCGLFREAGLGAALVPLSQLAEGVPLYELTRGPLPAMEESLLSLGTAPA